jgi:unsaturated pyranuronate lyase
VSGFSRSLGEIQMSVSTVTHHRWADLAPEQITASIARRYITAERVTVARFELKRGGVVPMHAHENEQISIVIDGALRFTIDGREIVVRTGEVMQIPPNVPHQVEVIDDTLVFDVFSPIRQDWIDKTDTYFRR